MSLYRQLSNPGVKIGEKGTSGEMSCFRDPKKGVYYFKNGIWGNLWTEISPLPVTISKKKIPSPIGNRITIAIAFTFASAHHKNPNNNQKQRQSMPIQNTKIPHQIVEMTRELIFFLFLFLLFFPSLLVSEMIPQSLITKTNIKPTMKVPPPQDFEPLPCKIAKCPLVYLY